MPKFTIIQKIEERFVVIADTAQDALDLFLSNGRNDPDIEDLTCAGVDERWVEDEYGNECEVEEP